MYPNRKVLPVYKMKLMCNLLIVEIEKIREIMEDKVVPDLMNGSNHPALVWIIDIHVVNTVA